MKSKDENEEDGDTDKMNRSPANAARIMVNYNALYQLDLKRERMIPYEMNNEVAHQLSGAVFGAERYHDIVLQFMIRYVEPEYRGIFLREMLPWVIRRRLKETDRYEVEIVRKNETGIPERVRIAFYRSEKPDCAIMGFING